MSASGVTKTDKALEKAFEVKGANTFYLLSDGSPTYDDGKVLPDKAKTPEGPSLQKILEMVRDKNKFRRVKIFTLGFVGANRRFMQDLADQNYGKYRDIK